MSPDANARSAVSLRRIPSLDGLRAISILLVLLQHTVQRYSVHHPVGVLAFALSNGALGVYIFFVISGYLITRLLLHEHASTGGISMPGFYLRRAFRIFPPLYAYVGALIVLALLHRLAMTRLDVLSALLFFHNYGPPHSTWALEHFWSLSIEEQFYLLWPLLLLFCLRRGGKRGRWMAAKVALWGIALSPVMRVIAFTIPSPVLRQGEGFHMHADALMFGCVAALLEGHGGFERVYRAATRLPWLPPVTIVVCSFLEARFRNYWDFPLGFTVVGTAITASLLWVVRNPHTMAGRALNARAITHIGVLSYSIYLWQTLFLHGLNPSVFRGWTPISTFPGNWIAILLVAELSYSLVESPSLRLRHRVFRLLPSHRGTSGARTGQRRVPQPELVD